MPDCVFIHLYNSSNYSKHPNTLTFARTDFYNSEFMLALHECKLCVCQIPNFVRDIYIGEIYTNPTLWPITDQQKQSFAVRDQRGWFSI